MSSLFVMMVSTLVTLGVNQVFTQDVSNTQDATNLLSGQPAGMVSSGGAGIPPQEYHCPDHQIPHAGHRAPFDRRRPPEQSTVRHIQAQGGDPQTRSTNPLTALSSFLSSDTTDNRTPMEILRHFQRLLTRTGMTFPPDVVRPLFLRRLPADIQQILLVSDAPLEQLALKADAIIAAKTSAPTVATVSVTTVTPSAPLESLTA